MTPIKTIMVFGNFNVAAFDEHGEQIQVIQENLLTLWAQRVADKGFDPTSTIIETPSGRWHIFKTESGYNLEST